MSGHCRKAMLRNRVVMAQYWSKDRRPAIDRGWIRILDDEFVDQGAKLLGQRGGVGGDGETNIVSRLSNTGAPSGSYETIACPKARAHFKISRARIKRRSISSIAGKNLSSNSSA